MEFFSKERREVKCITKDSKGTISGIGGEWGKISVKKAIEDIESNRIEYFVKNNREEVTIYVKSSMPNIPLLDPIFKFLSTNPDNNRSNNLNNLPGCEEANKKH